MIRSSVLVVSMFIGSLLLWTVMPVGWLWVGSQVEAGTNSLGLALLSIAIGVGLSIALVVRLLRQANHRHQELQANRGKDISGLSALELILIVTGGIAVAGFLIWFIALSGTSPLPLNLTY